MQLKDKTVFITGGTGGIGIPLVKLLQAAGTTVTAYDIEKDGDLIANLDKVCDTLKENTPDILINMAGYNVLDYCENQNLESIVDLNMIVPMRLTQAVLPTMKVKNAGQIINMGSMTALIPLPHLTGYVAAKAGLKGFNDALRRELSGTNIKITHIAPRAVKTPMNSGVKAEVNERTNVKYDDPADVSQWIFNAIVDKKPDVRFGWPERFFAFMHANFPSIIDKGLQKNCRIGEDALNNHYHKKEKQDDKIIPQDATQRRAAS